MVTWVETHITQGACAYPITSSTTMGGGYQVEVANGKKNLWGEELAFIEQMGWLRRQGYRSVTSTYRTPRRK
jgi:hypothetical protein